MPYPRKYLNPGETVIVDLHPHWASIAFSTVTVGVSALLLLVLRLGDKPRWLLAFVGLVTLVLCGWAMLRWAGRLTTYFVVTSDRVIYREGLVTRTGVEIPLEKVNNVNFKQSLFERAIGAGDLLIESGGQDGAQRFSDIPAPAAVQNQLALAIEGNDRSRYTPQDAPSRSDAAERARWLHALADEGILSSDELAAALRRMTSR